MKLVKYCKGQMAVVMTLALATLLGVMALGADVGVMYFQHLQMQKAADAASLAGANYLDQAATGLVLSSAKIDPNCVDKPDDAQRAACTYAIHNGLAFDANSLTMNEDVAGAPTPNIQVIATRSDLPYMFGRVIGLTTYNLAAAATAHQGATGATTGLFPMGFQCDPDCKTVPLQAGNTVAFNQKFSPTGNASGNWQWVQNPNVGNSGNPGVASGITNGLTGTYAVGDPLALKPGGIGSSQPVSNAFNNRFSTSNCPNLGGDPCTDSSITIPPDDPCMVVVPALDFTSQNGTSNPPLIEAFAQVYIEPGSTITNINACFVKNYDIHAMASGGPDLGSVGKPILVQ